MKTELTRKQNFGTNLSGNLLGEPEYKYHLTFWDNVNHRKDNIKHTGYSFRGNVLWKSISNMFYKEDKRRNILMALEVAITHLIDSVKMIKKTKNWVLEKNYVDFN